MKPLPRSAVEVRGTSTTSWWAICCCTVILLQTVVVLSDNGDGVKINGKERAYFLKAETVEWDYAPSGINLCTGRNYTEDEEIFVKEGFGSKYKKAVFREYTDGSFTKTKPLPPEQVHMGLLGPPLYAEVDDVIVVTLMNELPFAINFAPQGVALHDGVVNSGEALTYRWEVTEVQGPSSNQASSVMWLYRSTLDQIGHANAGLVGPIVITRKGEANKNGRAKDVDVDLFMVFEVWNENESPFLEDNLGEQTIEDFGLTEEEFEEANLMHGINGYVYCHVPEMVADRGDKVRWHTAAVGNEVDLHTAHWHGNTLNMQGRNMDSLPLLPGVSYSLDMTTDNPGTWLLHCHVNDHILAGMQLLYTINGAVPNDIRGDGTVREYFIAAEMTDWDYAPQDANLCSGEPVPFGEDENVFLEHTDRTIGQKYLKGQYIQYTDATFTTPIPRAQEDAYLGLLGPTLRAAVGDTILVTFKNKDIPHNVSLHPHGVFYEKASEGAPYNDGTIGRDKLDDYVGPGEMVVMTWHVNDRAGPGNADESSIVWMYHSHTDEVSDTNTGLVGVLIVTRKDAADIEARPRDVDRELVLFFSVINEGESLLFDDNIARFLPDLTEEETQSLKEDEDFQESNLMHQINGYLYCNAPELSVVQGQKVRWHIIALGTEVDMHTPNMQAAVLDAVEEPKETLQLIAGSMEVADSTPLLPGRFQIACRIAHHISAGMVALLTVKDGNMALQEDSGVVRSYYVMAEEVDWDYTPYGYDGCTGQDFNDAQRVFTETTTTTLGSIYKKAIYSGFTDSTFSQRVPKDPQHGILGPLIAAEAGNILRVILLNNLTDQEVNFNVGGLVAEGEVIAGGPFVAPGEMRTYEFVIPLEAGPCQSCTPNTATFVYTSTVDFVAQSYSGLVGPLLVTAPGALGSDGVTPVDVDKVVPVLFAILNENKSPFLDANIVAAEAELNSVVVTDSEDFEESNLMHAINGYLYCNMPRITMANNEVVRMIIMGLGSETDLHVPVLSGNRFVFRGNHVSGVEIMPSTSYAVDLRAPLGPEGVFDFYCDVHDHFDAGMRAQILVESGPSL